MMDPVLRGSPEATILSPSWIPRRRDGHHHIGNQVLHHDNCHLLKLAAKRRRARQGAARPLRFGISRVEGECSCVGILLSYPYDDCTWNYNTITRTVGDF